VRTIENTREADDTVVDPDDEEVRVANFPWLLDPACAFLS
jgi:hypothetical protein